MAQIVSTFYEADSGTVYRIRISQDDLTAQPSTPATGATQPGHAKVSRSRNSYGLRPRGVTLSRAVGTGTDTANKYKFFPVLNQADYATVSGLSTLTVGGVDWVVVGKQAELER